MNDFAGKNVYIHSMVAHACMFGDDNDDIIC